MYMQDGDDTHQGIAVLEDGDVWKIFNQKSQMIFEKCFERKIKFQKYDARKM